MILVWKSVAHNARMTGLACGQNDGRTSASDAHISRDWLSIEYLFKRMWMVDFIGNLCMKCRYVFDSNRVYDLCCAVHLCKLHLRYKLLHMLTCRKWDAKGTKFPMMFRNSMPLLYKGSIALMSHSNCVNKHPSIIAYGKECREYETWESLDAYLHNSHPVHVNAGCT